MQSPISINTLLNNRYRLVKVLGQGGFGRTYLAEDQGRFNERCALKEMIPNQEADYLVEKSKELFQREASTLYQIQHPQIPQFRATFEEDGRLFLVRDYVDGKTLGELLKERQAQGQVFQEAEVRKLVEQLLPVLAYIHSKGIIHRDISPDNIILSQLPSTQEPVPILIDFGVVKELATRFQSPEGTKPATTVGKLGYSPSEQIQMGQVYPSSDLYSLAVTALVLLTGKDPRELFDAVEVSWHWRRWATVSDRFALVLDRMLSHRPSDRYSSAEEVMQALQGPSAPTPAPPPRQPDNELSHLATVAVGRRPEPVTPPPPQQRPATPEPVVPPPQSQSPWDNPFLVALAILLGALIAGLVSWTVVSALYNATRPLEETPVETPGDPPLEPNVSNQRLNLSGGDRFVERGSLTPNDVINYIFTAEEGQRLTTSLESEGVWMSIFGPDGELVRRGARRVQSFEGDLPETGEYTIQLSPIPREDEALYSYVLNIELEAVEEEVTPTPIPTLTPRPTPTPEPTPTPTPEPTPTPTPEPTPEPTPTPIPTETIDPVEIPETPIPTPEPTPTPTAPETLE